MSATVTDPREDTGTSTSTRIAARLSELQSELEAGRRRLAQLDEERAQVRDTVLRIEGALMALGELGEPAPEPLPARRGANPSQSSSRG
jgi:hypothetical protein